MVVSKTVSVCDPGSVRACVHCRTRQGDADHTMGVWVGRAVMHAGSARCCKLSMTAMLAWCCCSSSSSFAALSLLRCLSHLIAELVGVALVHALTGEQEGLKRLASHGCELRGAIESRARGWGALRARGENKQQQEQPNAQAACARRGPPGRCCRMIHAQSKLPKQSRRIAGRQGGLASGARGVILRCSVAGGRSTPSSLLARQTARHAPVWLGGE